jgi:hypothetical protein
MNKYEFKVGDKIIIKQTCSGSYEGEIYTLIKHPTSCNLCVDLKNGHYGCSCTNNWILLKNKEIKVYGISIFLDTIIGKGK